ATVTGVQTYALPISEGCIREYNLQSRTDSSYRWRRRHKSEYDAKDSAPPRIAGNQLRGDGRLWTGSDGSFESLFVKKKRILLKSRRRKGRRNTTRCHDFC